VTHIVDERIGEIAQGNAEVTSRVTVLLVEEDPTQVEWVRSALGENARDEFQLVETSTIDAAVERIATGGPVDAVLLTLRVPESPGIEGIRRIAAATETGVIIVISHSADEAVGVTAVQAGAQDVLVKSATDGRMLRRALRFALERQTLLRQLMHRDDLTGLHNRRGFFLQAEQLIRTARRQRQPLLLTFVDLDDLKHINDTFGHAEGNRALVEAADVLRSCFRQSDLVARFGGDEFAALAIGGTQADERVTRTRLGEALAVINAEADRSYRLSFSVGTAWSAPGPGRPLAEMLEEADRSMYRAKRRLPRLPRGTVPLRM
jgi:two-component system cell cycle response regulator